MFVPDSFVVRGAGPAGAPAGCPVCAPTCKDLHRPKVWVP